MRAGQLRHRITIQQLVDNSPSQTPSGAPDQTWVTLYTGWGRVRPLAGRELLLAQQVNAKVDTEIEMRYRSGVTAAMRALYAGRVYDIQAAIDQDERHWTLILRCATGASQG